MIHEIALELQTALRAKLCPIPVVDREGAAKLTSFERIVIEHDDDAGDSFTPPRSAFKNPKHDYRRVIGAKATIYAQSRATGALEFEHRRRAEKIIDIVLGAMRLVTATRQNKFLPKTGRFVLLPDAEGTDRRVGAAYVLKFTCDRAVERRDWAAAAPAEGALAAFTRTTKVSLQGGDDDGDPTTVPADAETACGA